MYYWLTGVVGGGPNLDGKYPLTDSEEVTYMVYCPAALEDTVQGPGAETLAARDEAVQAALDSQASADQGVADMQAIKDSLTYDLAQISADKDAVAAMRTETQGYANEASTSAQDAQAVLDSMTVDADSVYADRLAADASATAAATSETNAGTSETNALASETKAGQWAEEAVDIEVELGKYSAMHHATKAAADASAADADATATAADRVATGNDATAAGTARDEAVAARDYLAAAYAAQLYWGGNLTVEHAVWTLVPLDTASLQRGTTLSFSATGSYLENVHTSAVYLNLTGSVEYAPHASGNETRRVRLRTYNPADATEVILIDKANGAVPDRPVSVDGTCIAVLQPGHRLVLETWHNEDGTLGDATTADTLYGHLSVQEIYQ